MGGQKGHGGAISELRLVYVTMGPMDWRNGGDKQSGVTKRGGPVLIAYICWLASGARAIM